MNIEEKRHLQKLLFADIDAAIAAHEMKRRNARAALVEQLVENPSADITTLVDDVRSASRMYKEKEEILSAAGYRLDAYAADRLAIAYGNDPAELVAFDEHTERLNSKFTDLKRSYMLKLFAGGEEVRGLFETLFADIEAIA